MGRWENLSYKWYTGVGEYNIPEVHRVDEIPDIDKWVQFNYAKSIKKNREKTGINFYITDQQFERVWNMPLRYVDMLSNYGVVCGPDFSTYTNFPKAMRVYNTYRNMWLTRFWQEQGICMVPNVRGNAMDYDWCFDGIPENSIISVSNLGSMESNEKRKNFMSWYNEMYSRLQPKLVLFYACKIDDYKGNIKYIMFNIDKKVQSDKREYSYE